MADFLRTSRQITGNVEQVIARARTFVHIVTPDLAYLPDHLFNLLYHTLLKGAMVKIIYSESTNPETTNKISMLKNVGIYMYPDIQSGICCNEREGIITSSRLFPDDTMAQFGIHIRKMYATSMFENLVTEITNLITVGTKMTVVDGKFVSALEAFAARQKSISEVVAIDKTALPETKPLTISEKQKLIVEILAEQGACTVKVEDEHRIRIPGTGIVIQSSKERVDVVFVHYENYQAHIHDIKKVILSRHPDVKAGFTYNRMTFFAQNKKEITSLAETMREVVRSYKLI